MPEISIKAEKIFDLFHIPVTNSLLLAVLTMVVLLVVGLVLSRRLATVPGKLQSMLELVIEQFLDLMDSVFGDRKKSEKYFPIIVTVFIFILFSNWFGLLPIVGPLHVQEIAEHGEHAGEVIDVPLLRGPAADLNFTLALGIISVFAVNFLSLTALGVRKFWGRFFSKDPILSSVGVLEIVSEFVKVISFSFRLFGNVFAGEVLLLIIGFLLPTFFFFGILPFLFLEVFVGFMQAFIFSMLTMVFMAMATAEHAH